MATIYERNSGTFGANFYEDGQRSRFSLRTKDRREALHRIEELEEAHERGQFDPFDFEGDPMEYEATNASLTLGEAFERYTEEKRREGMKENTLESYRCTWNALVREVGDDLKLENLTAGQIEDVIHVPDLAQSTQHMRYRHIRAILNHLECADALSAATEPKRQDSLPTPVRRDDLSALTAELKRDYRSKRETDCARPGQMIWQIPLWRFIYFTGLRRGEAARLRWKDIDIDANVIRLREQKNRTENATVPLVSKAKEAIRHAARPREPEMYVWRSPYEGDPVDRNPEKFADHTSRTFSKVRENCDAVTEEFTLHDVRAGFATHLASNGVGAHEIRSAMRHASVETSLKYIRVANSDLRESMEEAF